MNIYKSFEEFLRGNNIELKKEDDTISFSYSQKHFILFYDPKNPDYYRLMLPHIGRINTTTDNKENEVNILRELISLTTNFKVGKAIVLEDNSIWLSYEQTILDIDGDYSNIFSRSIIVLSKMLDDYRNFIAHSETAVSKTV